MLNTNKWKVQTIQGAAGGSSRRAVVHLAIDTEADTVEEVRQFVEQMPYHPRAAIHALTDFRSVLTSTAAQHLVGPKNTRDALIAAIDTIIAWQHHSLHPAMTVFAVDCETSQNETHIVSADNAEDAIEQVCRGKTKHIVAVIAGAHPDVRHFTNFQQSLGRTKRK